MMNGVNVCFWRVFMNKRYDETCNFLFLEGQLYECCSPGSADCEGKMRLYFPNMCLRREDMMNGVNVCFWRVFMNKRYDETCNFLFLEGQLYECCSPGSADCEGKMRLYFPNMCLRREDMMNVVNVCFFEEVDDEGTSTVIVLPQDRAMPCLLFKTKEVKFYVILLLIR